MKTYIFAIGGSGIRVLRALTMLLAAGVEVPGDIVPIILDPDAQNGDLQRAVSELRLYATLHGKLTFDNTTRSKFFATTVSSLNGDGNYLLPLGNQADITFDAFVALSRMSAVNEAMMRMLFSNNNLAANMNVGFKGNPNIGSVVLNQFTTTPSWQNFENGFVAGDRVFIVSSIFGGTGASGFPLLLKSMRTSTVAALKGAPIGAVSLLPYFNLQQDDKSAIAADSFITKMKAALNYYEKNVTGNNSLDDMYYLGDALPSKAYTNADGGKNQKNDAHVIELLAALAVVDFINKAFPAGAPSRTTVFHEYALTTPAPSGSITFSDLGPNTRALLLKPLSRMALMNSYLNNRDKDHRYQQLWSKGLGDKFFASPFFQDYDTFKCNSNDASAGFERWLAQMAANDKSFAPFVDDTALKDRDGLTKIKGYTPSYKWLGKKGYNRVDECLSKESQHLGTFKAPTAFMELFHRALDAILTNNLNIK